MHRASSPRAGLLPRCLLLGLPRTPGVGHLASHTCYQNLTPPITQKSSAPSRERAQTIGRWGRRHHSQMAAFGEPGEAFCSPRLPINTAQARPGASSTAPHGPEWPGGLGRLCLRMFPKVHLPLLQTQLSKWAQTRLQVPGYPPTGRRGLLTLDTGQPSDLFLTE